MRTGQRRAPGPAVTVTGAVTGGCWAALGPWVVSRALALGALAAAHLTVARTRPHNPSAAARVGQGLLGWDGGWYESIARHGYAAAGVQSVRFFPFFPMAARVLGAVPGVGVPAALLVLANGAAFGAMALLWVLVRHETGDVALARRSTWLLALSPPAFVLVFGYADALLLAATVAAFLAYRTGHWWTAAVVGVVAGSLRPVGVLLAVPAFIEAVRPVPGHVPGWGRVGWGARLARVAAVLAPVAGAGGFLLWVRAAFGDAWLPFRLQSEPGHRGGLASPFTTVTHDLSAAAGGHHLGEALHVPWVVLCLALAVVAFRRLPVSYGAFAAVVLAVSVSSTNLDSFERYALGAFPLVVAAATLLERRWLWRVVLAGSAAAMVAYTYGAFVNILVP